MELYSLILWLRSFTLGPAAGLVQGQSNTDRGRQLQLLRLLTAKGVSPPGHCSAAFLGQGQDPRRGSAWVAFVALGLGRVAPAAGRLGRVVGRVMVCATAPGSGSGSGHDAEDYWILAAGSGDLHAATQQSARVGARLTRLVRAGLLVGLGWFVAVSWQ
eukprot:COSAG06_NODE_496_length_15043_cov_8.883565_14_plen_159_part_00